MKNLEIGCPCRARTYDPLINSQVLLPAELTGNIKSVCFALFVYRLTTSPLQNSGRLTDKNPCFRGVGSNELAGEAGLEPANAGVKVLCLANLATPQY